MTPSDSRKFFNSSARPLVTLQDFSNICKDNNIHFIGPDSNTIETMGNKSKAKETIKLLNVNVKWVFLFVKYVNYIFTSVLRRKKREEVQVHKKVKIIYFFKDPHNINLI